MSKLFIVVAPSGAGKTTLVEAVLKNPLVGSRLQKIITYTTRAPRDKEIHGQDYYFISEAEFEEKIEANFFIEHSFVYNKYYGSSCSDMNKADEDKENSLIAILDFSGAKEVKKRIPAAITIFIEPPSFSVLEQRILKRDIKKNKLLTRIRLTELKEEMESLPERSFFDYIISQGSLEAMISLLEEILAKESCFVKK